MLPTEGKVKRGKVTGEHADWNGDLRQAYATITLKVTNGTSGKMDLLTEAVVAYGADGEEATETYLSGDMEAAGPRGVLVPGTSRSGIFVFLIPERHHDDVTLDVTPDLDTMRPCSWDRSRTF